MSKPTDVWDPIHWGESLDNFARATGLAVGVYGVDGKRRLGPFIHQPVAQMVYGSGAFEERGAATAFEGELVEECLDTDAEVTRSFEGALLVRCRPAHCDGMLVGAFAYGWVYTRFPDPLLCERVARRIQLPSNRFWLVSRQQLAVSNEKLGTYESLLTTLTRAILEQLTFRRALLDADRMKDEFLSTLSHELRTPLTSVQLRLQSLVRSLPRHDSRLTQSLDAMQSGLRAQSRLINDLLDTSRVLTGKMSLDLENVNLPRIIRSAAETVQPMANSKGVELSVHVAESSRDIQGDSARLQQAIWNVLVNAVKFTPSGGRVRLELFETPDAFEVLISDSGAGIDPSFLPFVFDRFAQGRSSVSGSQRGLGLGLALVRYIAELHGGTVSADSDGVGRGSSFRIRLPAPRVRGC